VRHFYTDGSVQNLESSFRIAGSAYVELDAQSRVLGRGGISSHAKESLGAEVDALCLVLVAVSDDDDVMIHTDSLSALQIIMKVKDTGVMDERVRQVLRMIMQREGATGFHKVKAHIGIIGNELADIEADLSAKRNDFFPSIHLKNANE